jgi:hypothetical protein
MLIDRICESCDDEATHEVICLDGASSRILCERCLLLPEHPSSSRKPVAGPEIVDDIQDHLATLPAALRVTTIRSLRSSLDEVLRGELVQALRDLRTQGKSWADVGRLAGLSRPQVANLVADRDRRRRSAERAAKTFRATAPRTPATATGDEDPESAAEDTFSWSL